MPQYHPIKVLKNSWKDSNIKELEKRACTCLKKNRKGVQNACGAVASKLLPIEGH